MFVNLHRKTSPHYQPKVCWKQGLQWGFPFVHDIINHNTCMASMAACCHYWFTVGEYEVLQFLLVECMGIVAIPVCMLAVQLCSVPKVHKSYREGLFHIATVICSCSCSKTVTHSLSLCRYGYTLPHIHGQAMIRKGNTPKTSSFEHIPPNN